MRIYLQTPLLLDGPPRFYHLLLQQDILEGWNLIRVWGVEGGKGTAHGNHFQQREEAEERLLQLRDRQIARGYRVMFVEGTSPDYSQGLAVEGGA